MDTTKKLMTMLLVLLGMTQAVSQEYEYVPFVREGIKWVCYYDNPINATDPESTFFPSGQHYYTLELKGDTVINGKSYKPLHFYSGKSINEENDTIPVYLREENKIVYGIIPDDTRYYECPIGIGTMVLYTNICATDIETGVEFTLYDFNDLETFYDSNAAEAPDSSWPLLKRDCSISTDTILIGDQLRKRLVIHSPYSWDEYIIEGIGYARNGLPGNPFNYFYNITTGVNQVIYNLCHIIENDKIVYRALWCEDLEPEPDGYEYVPFVREGIKWVYRVANTSFLYPPNPSLPEGIFYFNLEFKGDTIINGKTYKAMHKYYGDAINEENDTVPIYMREENKVVYGIIPDGRRYADCPVCRVCGAGDDEIYSGNEFLMYDFSDPIGFLTSFKGGIEGDYYSYYEHQYTDTIAVGNHLVKCYNGTWWGVDCRLVEGIGLDNTTSSYTLCIAWPIGEGVLYFSFSHLIENGEIVYKGLSYSPIVPGDVNGDGEVNIGDINSVIDVVIMGGNASHPRPGEDGEIDGDVNGDGEVNIGDINAIINMILNNH